MKKYEIANIRQRTNHTFLWMVYYALILSIFSGIVLAIDKNVKKCKLNKYDELGQFLAGLENTEYTKEDIAEIISYAKYIDFKKQAK